MTVPNSPLPLVTLTLTTDEMAMASAGLVLLRRHWQQAATYDSVMVGKVIMSIDAFRQRLEGNVTEEQGRMLLSTLIEELKRRPNE
jgi:hypothetical protein